MANNKGSSFTVTDETFTTSSPFRKSITRFQRNGTFSDVTVIVEGRQLKCHRFLLAGNSPYFESMFACGMKESRASKVTLKDVPLDAFELILDYLYKGTMTVWERSFVGLLKTLDMLQFDETLRIKLLKEVQANMGPTSCLAFMTSGDAIGINSITNTAKEHALANFKEVVESRAFLDMQCDQLVTYLSNDELFVKDEENVFNAICKWIEVDAIERKQHAPELLSCVRFCFMKPENVFPLKDYPLFTDVPEFENHLDAAKQHFVVPCRQEDEHYYKCKPRVCQMTVTLVRPRSSVKSYSSDTLGIPINILTFTDEIETSASRVNTTKCCTIGQNLYVLIGRQLWLYLQSNDAWIHLQDRKNDVINSTLTVCGDNLYAIGGNNLDGEDEVDYDANVSDVIEQYNWKSQQWVKSHRNYHLVHPITCHSTVSFKNHLYVIGGKLPDGKHSNIVQIVSANANRVEVGPVLPKEQFTPSALVFNSYIYSIGSGHCFRLDIGRLTWTIVEPPKQGRPLDLWYALSVVVGNKIVLFGGKDSMHTKCVKNVVIFDPQAEKYTLVEPLEMPSLFNGAVTFVSNEHLKWL